MASATAHGRVIGIEEQTLLVAAGQACTPANQAFGQAFVALQPSSTALGADIVSIRAHCVQCEVVSYGGAAAKRSVSLPFRRSHAASQDDEDGFLPKHLP